jgi:hypothetical protein
MFVLCVYYVFTMLLLCSHCVLTMFLLGSYYVFTRGGQGGNKRRICLIYYKIDGVDKGGEMGLLY